MSASRLVYLLVDCCGGECGGLRWGRQQVSRVVNGRIAPGSGVVAELYVSSSLIDSASGYRDHT